MTNKVLDQLIEAFDLRLGERVPGKCIESRDWQDRRHDFFFASDYPALYRAVARRLRSEKVGK